MVDGTGYRIGLKKLSQGRISLGSVQAFFADHQSGFDSVASERMDEQHAESARDGDTGEAHDPFDEEFPHPSPRADPEPSEGNEFDWDEGSLDQDAPGRD